MKKLLLICVCSFIFIASRAQTGSDGTIINFSTQLIDPTGSTINHPRSPIRPPKASLSGHTLYILTSHGDYDLQLLSYDGSVVYETYVPCTVNVVALPSSLSGEFEIQLLTDTHIFIGRIEL